jgi:hypothetical protein
LAATISCVDFFIGDELSLWPQIALWLPSLGAG